MKKSIEHIDLSNAFSLLDNNKLDEAKIMFQEALNGDQNQSKSLYGLGICHYREDSIIDAKKLFLKSVELAPNNYNAHYYLGLISEKEGNTNEAIAKYKKALTIKPDFAEAEVRLSELGIQTEQIIANTRNISQNETEIDIDTGEPQFSCQQRAFSIVTFKRFFYVYIFFSLAFVTFVIQTDGGIQDWPPILFSALGISFVLLFIYSFIGQWCSNYAFYSDRIEIQQGVVFRKKYTVWNFQIKSVVYRRNPIYYLFNSGYLVIELEHPIPTIGQSKLKQYTGIGAGIKLKALTIPEDAKKSGVNTSHQFMLKLWRVVRDNSLQQRRSIKKWWI